MKIDKKDKNLIKSCARQYTETPVYARAVTIHRTHKNKKLTIKKNSFLYGIYRDNSKKMIIKKSTQTGISEYLICRALYRAENGTSIFYVLPTYELKNQFVKERIDKSILLSPYYRMILSAAENKMAESMSLKQIGRGVIAFVGSNTSNAFLSFAADDVIIDELDNCNQGNIIMAEERQSASPDKMSIKVGNPTITNYGIDLEYENSDKKKWFIKHDCGSWIYPDFFKHVVRFEDNICFVLDKNWDRQDKDPYPICDRCGEPFDRYSVGEWVSQNASSKISGYHVSKMFSTEVTLTEMIERFSKGLVNESIMQRFYNGDLGLAYTAKGATIDRQILEDAKSDYLMSNYSNGICVMGIDVGSVLNIIIGEIINNGIRIVYIGEINDFNDIDDLMRKYNVKSFVVDAMPEVRASKKITRRHRFGWICFYTTSKKELTIQPKDRTINTYRTAALDTVKENLLTKNLLLPKNAETIPNFYEQMSASTRVYNEERNEYEWVHGSEPDHYFHASAYMMLARRLLLMARNS